MGIKSIRVITYVHKNGKKIKIREEHFDPDVKVLSTKNAKKVVHYDEKGNVTKVVEKKPEKHHHHHHSSTPIIINKENVRVAEPKIIQAPPKMEVERAPPRPPEPKREVEMIVITPPSKTEMEEYAKKVGEVLKAEKEARMTVVKPKTEKEMRLEMLAEEAEKLTPRSTTLEVAAQEEKRLKELRTIGTKDILEGAGLTLIGAGIGFGVGGPVGATAGAIGTAGGYAIKRGLEVGLASILPPEPPKEEIRLKIRDITAPVYRGLRGEEISPIGMPTRVRRLSTSEIITAAGDIAFLTTGAAIESATERALTAITPKKISKAFAGEIYPISKSEIAAKGEMLSVIEEKTPFGRKWEVEEPFALRVKTLVSETKGKSSFTELKVDTGGYGFTTRGSATGVNIEKTFSAVKIDGKIGDQKIWEIRASEDLIGKGIRLDLLEAGRKSIKARGIEATKDTYAVRMLDYSAGKTTSRIEIRDFIHYEGETTRGLFTVGELKRITKELPKAKDIPKLTRELKIEKVDKMATTPVKPEVRHEEQILQLGVRRTTTQTEIPIIQARAIAESLAKRIPKIKLRPPSIAPAISFVRQVIRQEKTIGEQARDEAIKLSPKLIPKFDLRKILKQKPKEIQEVKTIEDIMNKIKQTQKERQKQVPKTIRGRRSIPTSVTTPKLELPLLLKVHKPLKISTPKPKLPKIRLPKIKSTRIRCKREIAENEYKWKSILKLFFS